MPKWDDLIGQFQATVFQDLNWLKNWWDFSYKDNFIPYIIQIKDEEKTIGIFPLYIDSIRFARMTFRILKPMGSGISDYLIPILSKNYAADDLLYMALKAIYEDRANWDYIEWEDVPEDSELSRFLDSHHLKRFILERNIEEVCPYFNIDGGIDELKQKISKKFLSEISRVERKLKREGTLEFSKVTKEEEIIPIMNKFFELHCKRWKNTTTPSEFRYEEKRNFLLSAAKSLFKSNLLHLRYIRFNEEIMVVHFGISDGIKSYLYLHAINIDFRKYSPGSLLVYYLILEAEQEGFQVVDFLRGDEGYKERWNTKEKFNIKYEFFNHSLKSRLFRFIFHTHKNQQFIKRLSYIHRSILGIFGFFINNF